MDTQKTKHSNGAALYGLKKINRVAFSKPYNIIVKQKRHHEFIENLNSTIENHLSEGGLTINRLTKLIGVSRTDLHRKITLVSGMSASKYIRSYRLKKAAHTKFSLQSTYELVQLYSRQ